jgi:hypothetical protein
MMYSLSMLIVELESARRRLLYFLEVPDAKQQANLDASSTGLKSRSWALNNLRKGKRALALLSACTLSLEPASKSAVSLRR